MEGLELKMYFLVNYQLSGMQGGIQAGHAGFRFLKKYWKEEFVQDFLENWETWIVLNGGTTNTNPERLGTMNLHLQTLNSLGVKCHDFYEPDLGDQLTAIAFILDERIFDRKKYPDFDLYLNNIYSKPFIEKKLDESVFINSSDVFYSEYQTWLALIGGENNRQLREFIKPFKLA